MEASRAGVFVCEGGVTWDNVQLSVRRWESVLCALACGPEEQRKLWKRKKKNLPLPVKVDSFYTFPKAPPAHGMPPSRAGEDKDR